MSQALYGLGFLIIVGGVAYIAHLMHVPQAWIIGIVIVLVGMGLVSMVQTTRHKDPS